MKKLLIFVLLVTLSFGCSIKTDYGMVKLELTPAEIIALWKKTQRKERGLGAGLYEVTKGDKTVNVTEEEIETLRFWLERAEVKGWTSYGMETEEGDWIEVRREK